MSVRRVQNGPIARGGIVMTCSINSGEMRVRSGKLASWWRHWSKRGVVSGPGPCCDADEHLARVVEAVSREPHVHAGKWPVDPISWRIERLGNIDTA
jgi:hypothetical protein